MTRFWELLCPELSMSVKSLASEEILSDISKKPAKKETLQVLENASFFTSRLTGPNLFSFSFFRRVYPNAASQPARLVCSG
jgi:hypothetical protein